MTREFIFVSSATSAWGAERSLWTLAESLLGKGERVSLVSCDSDLVAAWSARLGRADLISPVQSGIQGSLQWWKAFLRLRGEGLTDQTAVVVFSLQLTPVALLLRATRRSSRPRVVLDLHDSLTSQRGRLKIRLLATAFDHVVSVSGFTASQLFKKTPVTILTRPMTPDSSPNQVGALKQRTVRPRAIGVVGRLDPDKNVEFAYKVMLRLDEGDVLILRGAASPGNEKYAQRLVSAGADCLGERLVWQGRVAGNSAMDAIDVLLAVNPNEAMGRTILEAQLAGVPVVVPNSGGTAELVSHGLTGRIYQAGDPDAAAREIRAIEQDLPAIVSTARKEALAATDADNYADRYSCAVWA